MIKDWLKNLPKVKGKYLFDEKMDKYSWLNAGGSADVLYFPSDIEDLQFFLKNISRDVPLTILGNGSNILVRDGGIAGVVIKLTDKYFGKINIHNDYIECEAGVKNSSLKKVLIDNEIGGLEFICSIPGSIGGLIKTNAGCFGSEVSDVLIEADAVDQNGNVIAVLPKDLNFTYRNSAFPNDWIITKVKFKKQKSTKENIQQKLEEQTLYRKAHQPYGVRTAGSTFKNPQGAKAWELLKNSGANKLIVGGASFSEKHCNFLINDGTATATEIEQLGEMAQQLIKNKMGIDLEWEIKIIGKK